MNEVLSHVKEQKVLKEIKELYEFIRDICPAGSTQREAAEEKIREKYQSKDELDKVEIIYNEESLDDWKAQLQRKGLRAKEEIHFRVEDEIKYKNINEASYTVDEEEFAKEYCMRHRRESTIKAHRRGIEKARKINKKAELENKVDELFGSSHSGPPCSGFIFSPTLNRLARSFLPDGNILKSEVSISTAASVIFLKLASDFICVFLFLVL